MLYKSYDKSAFQNCLNSIRYYKNILGWEEVSIEIASNSIDIKEYVYRISLKNKAASIIVFSSVDKRTDSSREVGSDAVRLVYEWVTKNGLRYSKIKKKYRVNSLFENLKQSLIEESEKCFSLHELQWCEHIEEAI